MNPDSPENPEEVGIDVQQLVLCIGRHAFDGCGYVGGRSGGTCPDCGGMLLSQKAINIADKAAREWKKRDAEKQRSGTNRWA